MISATLTDCSLMVAFWSPSPGEMLLVMVVALLLYGGKLPEVARSWGKSFTEFRRGLSDIKTDLNEAIYSEPQRLGYDPEVSKPKDESAESISAESAPDDDSRTAHDS